MHTVPCAGGSVTVRDAGDLCGIHLRVMRTKVGAVGADLVRRIIASGADTTDAAILDAGISGVDVGVVDAGLEAMSDAALWAVVESWTLPQALPMSPEAVRGLPVGVREDLAEAVRTEAAQALGRVLF